MPDTYPNPFVATSPLGDTLRSLSDTIMSGPTEAQRIYQAEQALKLQSQRKGGDALASTFLKYGTPTYDPRQQAANAVQAGVNPEHLAQTDRYLAANTKGIDDPATSASFVGAGGAFGSTPQGFREATARTLAQKTYEFDNTFETMRAPDGRLVPVARNKVADATTRGYTVQPSTDQVKANILTGALPGQPQGVPPAPPPVPFTPISPDGLPVSAQPYAAAPMQPSSSGPAQPAAPVDPISGLPSGVQHLLGVNQTPHTIVVNGQSYVTYDGRTDARTSQPLPFQGASSAGAYMATPQGDLTGVGIQPSVKGRQQEQDISLQKLKNIGDYATQLIQPQTVGLPGAIHSTVQNVAATVANVAKGLGADTPQQWLDQARARAVAGGMDKGTIDRLFTFDPNIPKIETAYHMLTLSAAEALAGGMGRASDRDMRIVQHMFGSPEHLFASPEILKSKMDAINDLIGLQRGTINQNLHAGSPLTQGTVQAAPGATAAPPAAASGAPQSGSFNDRFGAAPVEKWDYVNGKLQRVQ